MSQKIDVKPTQMVTFNVKNPQHATGYGLHVASSHEADGTGRFPELFLQVDAAHRIRFVYLDAAQTRGSYIDISATSSSGPIAELAGLPSIADATTPAAGSIADPDPSPGSAVLDLDIGSKPTGLHRFEVDLGPKTEIASIDIVIRKHSLEVGCTRLSCRRKGPAREFSVYTSITQNENDLGALSPLFWQAIGLISGKEGSGWHVGRPKISTDGWNSEDLTLVSHNNTDPVDLNGG